MTVRGPMSARYPGSSFKRLPYFTTTTAGLLRGVLRGRPDVLYSATRVYGTLFGELFAIGFGVS